MSVNDRGGGERDPALLGALANPYRREALSVLSDADGAMTLPALVDAILARLDAPRKTADELHLLLYHVHAPRLAEVGLVDFDPRREVVRVRADSRHTGRLTS